MSALASDAELAIAVFAIDPCGIGGVCLRARPGPLRDAWLEGLRSVMPASTPGRKVPLNVSDSRLLGGLDLAATLRAGRPVAERGLLLEAHRGWLVLAMAERIGAAEAARICSVLDRGELLMERDGLTRRHRVEVGVVALDEGIDDDERPTHLLLERLAIHLDLLSLTETHPLVPRSSDDDIVAARARLGDIEPPRSHVVEQLCATACALGVDSLRASVQALHVARLSAALAGRRAIDEPDVVNAVRLVLAPRATQLPDAATQSEPRDGDAQHAEPAQEPEADSSTSTRGADREQQVLDAARAAIPPGVLARIEAADRCGQRRSALGRSGANRADASRGRAMGARAGPLRAGARLNVVETLRAAAPWQRLRRAQLPRDPPGARRRLRVHSEDFRLTRFKQRMRSVTIFAVDASGSTARQRLAEAKGAIELLLSECYARRDKVALIAFRGASAEVLLPPTRSLVRVKRSLRHLPGGGATPLANALELCAATAESVWRAGDSPLLVLLTDGRANIARDGEPGRDRAASDALAAASMLARSRLRCLLLDTSPRPSARARELSDAMRATYLPMPHADAARINDAVRDAGREAA